jgi:hypothetical protein
MWVAMSAAEREEFLTDVHIGVLSAAMGTAGRTPTGLRAQGRFQPVGTGEQR